jgi:TPR repeat protein
METGDPNAQNSLGESPIEGKDVPQDFEDAFNQLLKAAE